MKIQKSAHHAASRRAGDGQDRLANREKLLDDGPRCPPPGSHLRALNHFTKSLFAGASQNVALQKVAVQKVAVQEVASQKFALQEVALHNVALQKVSLQKLLCRGFATSPDLLAPSKPSWSVVARNRARWRKGPTVSKDGIYVLVNAHFRDVSRQNL